MKKDSALPSQSKEEEMWKRSFIFLVVLVWVVSSLCAYPAFFYGGAKEETPAAVEALPPEEASTEELEKSAPVLSSSAEASEEVASDRTEEFDDTKSVIELLEEARVKSSVIEKVKEACFLIDEGRAEMIAAYEEEADARAKAEKELNSAHYVLMPLAGYSLGSQVWSAGLAVAVEYRSLVLMAQAMKPITAGLDSFKAWDDLSVVVGAGVRF